MSHEQQNSSDDDARADRREHGITFGELASELESHDYPTTTDELIAEYGDRTLELPDGSQTLAEVLGVLSADGQQFSSPEAVREAIYLAAGADAVGRDEYTDRGGTVRQDDPSL